MSITQSFSPNDLLEVPDSEFSHVIYANSQPNLILTGNYGRTRIRLSDCYDVKIQDLRVGNGSELLLAGCQRHSIDGLELPDDSAFSSWPVSVKKENMRNALAWWSATNGAFIINAKDDKWSANFQQEFWEPVKIRFSKKNLCIPLEKLTETVLATCVWNLVDKSGKKFRGKFVGLEQTNEQELIALIQPRAEMVKGNGHWSVYDITKFTKGLRYKNIEAYRHLYWSNYFCKGLEVKDSSFMSAKLDYNFGAEMCLNVTLDNVQSAGNVTVQGGHADVAFLYGIVGLTIRNSNISILSIASNGWEVAKLNIQKDLNVSWIETSWLEQSLRK